MSHAPYAAGSDAAEIVTHSAARYRVIDRNLERDIVRLVTQLSRAVA